MKNENRSPGLKIFIFNADLTQKDMDTMLADLFLNGYEVYFLLARSGAAIDAYIRKIIDLFEETILFVNIDRSLPDIPSYTDFMKEIVSRYSNCIPMLGGGDEGVDNSITKIGVLHGVSPNRLDRDYENKMELFYLSDVKANGGFLSFGLHLRKNTQDLINFLDAHEYLHGYRRRTIRSICDNSSEKVHFNYEGTAYQYKLSDISISHFSTLIPRHSTPKPRSKLENVQISLKSAIFKADCILTLTKILTTDEFLCVFTFLHTERIPNGVEKETLGLNDENQQKVNHAILEDLQKKMAGLMRERKQE